MEVDPPSALQQQPYTIVRIKRKRNEEPLDALVADVAPSKKRSRGGLNVFQYAGTVEEAAWNDEQQKKELERHLADLARKSSYKKLEELSKAAPPTTDDSTVQQASTSASPAEFQPALTHPPKRAMHRPPGRTYTIVPQQKVIEDHHARRRQANAPPKVWSSKEYEAMKRAAPFKMYEAVPSTSGNKAPPVPDETDAEIEKFLPLLKDYLNVSELAPPPPITSNTSGNDYVYDVFYRRPTTFKELDPSSSNNIAKLTGLPPELSGLSGEDDSDSEDDDEDDEDSNAEDWYTNDYPEEEESDRDSEEDLSDEFHEHSGYDDVVHGDGRDFRTYRDVMVDL